MAENCVTLFGEFQETEFEASEFLVGVKVCAKTLEGIDCKNLFIFSKPSEQSQRELDYDALFKYVEKDLKDSIKSVDRLESIGKDPICNIHFNLKVKWLIDYLLLFKQELKQKPTQEEYKRLFDKYKLECIDKAFRKEFNKNYIKEMIKIIKVVDIVTTLDLVYQNNDSINAEFVYYQAEQNTNDIDPTYYLPSI